MELYRNGMRSLEEMKKLIHYVAETYDEILLSGSQEEIVEKIEEYVNLNLDRNLRKEDIVNLVHLNTDYITRLFRKERGISVKSYIIQQKLEAARKMIQTTNLSVSYIAARYGYTNFSHFSSAYKKQFGVTPQEDRRKNGIEIEDNKP